MLPKAPCFLGASLFHFAVTVVGHRTKVRPANNKQLDSEDTVRSDLSS